MTGTFHLRAASTVTVVAAALASAIAVGLLAAVVTLFERDGYPMERVLVAERACAGSSYVSEREVCMREWLATYRIQHVAQK